MNEAPKRIWIDPHGGRWSPMSGGTQGEEYVRADLPPTLSAALAVPEVMALVEAAWKLEESLGVNGANLGSLRAALPEAKGGE